MNTNDEKNVVESIDYIISQVEMLGKEREYYDNKHAMENPLSYAKGRDRYITMVLERANCAYEKILYDMKEPKDDFIYHCPT